LPTKAEGTNFQIHHYAGVVEYDSEFFLEKNRDLLAPAIVQSLQASTFAVVSELFGGDPAAPGSADGARSAGRRATKEQPSSDNTANKRAVSLGHQYTTSLEELIDSMSQCRPHFVRCIKPNHELRARDFQDELVLAQLKSVLPRSLFD
jgi:myosin-3